MAEFCVLPKPGGDKRRIWRVPSHHHHHAAMYYVVYAFFNKPLQRCWCNYALRSPVVFRVILYSFYWTYTKSLLLPAFWEDTLLLITRQQCKMSKNMKVQVPQFYTIELLYFSEKTKLYDKASAYLSTGSGCLSVVIDSYCLYHSLLKGHKL